MVPGGAAVGLARIRAARSRSTPGLRAMATAVFPKSGRNPQPGQVLLQRCMPDAAPDSMAETI